TEVHLPPSAPVTGTGMPYVPDPFDPEGDGLDRPRVFLKGEYLLSWFASPKIPGPLVTTGAATDAHPAALGQPNTSVLFGGDIDFGVFQGASATLGVVLDDNGLWTAEVSGFYIFPMHKAYSNVTDPAGTPIIARPVFNVNTQ